MISLYTASWCPFCQKVLAFCKENSIPIEEKDVDNHKNRLEFKAVSTEQVIPLMIDTETKTMLYDSGDILMYLRKKFLIKK